jgi:diguanylate cyclase (GGDEF)-like protein
MSVIIKGPEDRLIIFEKERMSLPKRTDQTPAQSLSQEFRQRTIRALGKAMLPFVVPFSIYSFIQGRLVIGSLLLLLALIVLVDVIMIRRRQRLIPFMLWAFYSIIMITLVYAIATIGIITTFWCYPAAFAVFFVAERSQARVMMMIGLPVFTLTAFYCLPADAAFRFSITLGVVCYFSDILIGILNEQQAQLTELSIRDPLTGAFNRRHMISCLQNAQEEVKRGLGRATLVAIDIDHFKRINDSLGHDAGDRVLKKLTGTLQQRIRRLDYVFRTGGEEFVILLRNTSLAQAVTFAEDLRRHIEAMELLEQHVITISAGLAEYDTAEDIDQWLKRADIQLYQAKQNGRNRVCPQLPV